MSKITIKDVKNFWDEHPLGSYEIKHPPGTKAYFEEYEEIRRKHVERFNMGIWKFDQLRGKKVLDVGCGIGFLVLNYARGGADITGIDISTTEVELVKRALELYNLKANVIAANAEELSFDNESFDFVSSSGSLQFTPNIQKAIDEIHRVLKRNGEAVISVYNKNIFLRKYTWRITGLLTGLFFREFPGAGGFAKASEPVDLIRKFDGVDNPFAQAFTKKEFRNMMKDFRIVEEGVYYIPLRFLPFHNLIPILKPVYRLLERYLGVMLYYRVTKD